MAERGLGPKVNTYKVGWEVSEFPILCETCLGDVPYVRMTRAEWDKECKICTRPFMVFRWKPGPRARFKKTEVCQTCSKVKNVCQTCLLDLEYGLPVEVRDKFLKEKVEIPKDIVNRDFWAHIKTKNFDTLDLPYEKEGAYPVLEKLSRTNPYYQRNLPQVCSFFVKGQCSRGSECPYKHVIPEINELSDQNVKDRFFGINDPVAKKILKGFNDSKLPNFPADKSIQTLFIGGLTDDSLREKDLLLIFNKYGEVKNIKILLKNYCAFITFAEREYAELAMTNLFSKCMIKGQKYKLMWGRPVGEQKTDDSDKLYEKKDISYKTECPIYESQNYSSDIATNTKHSVNYGVNLNNYSEGHIPYYPSMDPNSMGGILKNKKVSSGKGMLQQGEINTDK